MHKLVLLVALSLISVWLVHADVSHIVQHSSTTPPPGPPNPYVFSYQAGRAPGHVDRQHTEVSDGTGVIRGAFSYIDPRQELRTVEYVADENGFHPQLSHKLEDSEAVKLATQRHFALYNQIAQEHANGAQPYFNAIDAAPKNSEAVARATQKHQRLFEQIAAEHAAIGAQQEAQREALAEAAEHGVQPDDGQYHPETA